MSRAHDARRKTKRRQAQGASRPTRKAGPRRTLPLTILASLLIVAATIATVKILGSSASAETKIDQKVAALLANIPQKGPILGNPNAPITLKVFADLECPTVKRFVTRHFPSIVATWVRTGVIKLEYKSLRTDTWDEHTFFKQETAALAAGRQGKLWDFVLTAVHEQRYKRIGLGHSFSTPIVGYKHFEYVNTDFLVSIASRVSNLDVLRWRRDWRDPQLFNRVANGVRVAHSRDMRATPTFLIGRTDSAKYRQVGPKIERDYLINAMALAEDVEAFLGRSAAYLRNYGINKNM